MIIYHGTDEESAKNIINSGIDLSLCSEIADFGQGFYTTIDKNFAIKCANRASKRTDNNPALVVIDYCSDSVRGVKYFGKPSVEWLQFIVNNRAYNTDKTYLDVVGTCKDHNADARHHVVQGLTADGNIVDFVEYCIINKEKVQEEDISNIFSKNYPEQISFHTEKSLKHIKVKSIEFL